MQHSKNSNGMKSHMLLLPIFMVAVVVLIFTAQTASAGHHHRHPRACSKTASAAFLACQNEVKDDYWIAKGNCYNETEDQAECFAEAKEDYKDAREECRDQLDARKDLCEDLGEAPYDPQINPEDFVDFEEVVEDPTSFTPNPYFPLVPGTGWVYQTRDEDDSLLERITVRVEEDIKEIEYPADSSQFFKCAVVHDVVEEYDADEDEYIVIEDTYDWYAQDEITGDVWYLGEISLEFEDGELIGTEGSWKSGVEGAKPGIIMYASPDPDNEDQQNPYRQEFFLGDAEDVGEIISLGEESVTVPYGTFRRRVLKTKDFTPIEPDVEEFKYYAPGVGVVLEVNPEGGERVELIRFAPGP